MKITRKFEAQLIPADAYWREPTRYESKIDFAAIEESEGEAIHGHRLRLGLLLHAQREAIVRWTRSPRFSAASARRVPKWFSWQIGNEFVRIWARGYWDGLEEYGRQIESAGEDPAGLRLSEAATRRLIENAWTSGRAFAEKVLAPVRMIADRAFGADGARILPPDRIEGEIRTAYARWIEPSDRKVDVSEIRLASPLDILKTSWRSWQQRNSPIAAWLDWTIGSIKDEGGEIPILSETATKRDVLTERNRQRVAAVYESGLSDPDVAYYQYSAMRDSRTCSLCRSLDGTIRPKDDEFWYTATPPMHQSCRCDLVTIVKKEAAKVTPIKSVDRRGWEKIPAGFGGYDPSLAAGDEVLVHALP